MTRHPARGLDEWSTRYVARRDNIAVVVIDVEVTATVEDLDRVVAEVRAAKGWPSEAEQRDAWWDEAFQRQARTADEYRAEGREQERERIAAMVEALPTMVWVGIGDPVPFRARTPAEIAAEIRGEA